MSFNRAKFIEDVCSLVGTKFDHQGSNASTGVDCIHLPRLAFEMQGLKLPDEVVSAMIGYTNQPDGWKLQAVMTRWFEKVDEAQPADLLNLYVKRNPKHLAVVVKVDPIVIVEAYQSMDRRINEAVIHELDPRRRIAAIFRIPDDSQA